MTEATKEPEEQFDAHQLKKLWDIKQRYENGEFNDNVKKEET